MSSKVMKFTVLLALVLIQASLVSSSFIATNLSNDIHALKVDLHTNANTLYTCLGSTYTDAFDTTTNTWTTTASACYDAAVSVGTSWNTKLATPPDSLGLSTG